MALNLYLKKIKMREFIKGMVKFYKSHRRIINSIFLLIIAVSYIIFAICMIVHFPVYYKSQIRHTKELDLFKEEKEMRNLVIQIFGGFTLFLGMIFSYLRTRSMDEKNRIDESTAKNDLLLKQYTDAANLIANKDNINARLSGIFLFEKILTNNEEYYQPIIQLLISFVERNRNTSLFNIQFLDSGKGFHYKSQIFQDKKMGADIQAAIEVLGRRTLEFFNIDDEVKDIDLSEIFILKIKFNDSIFRYVDFRSSVIESVFISFYMYEVVFLEGTIFNNCDFFNVDFIGCDFDKTSFSNSTLSYVQFKDCSIININFKGSVLSDVYFKHILFQSEGEGRFPVIERFLKGILKSKELTNIYIENYVLDYVKENNLPLYEAFCKKNKITRAMDSLQPTFTYSEKEISKWY